MTSLVPRSRPRITGSRALTGRSARRRRARRGVERHDGLGGLDIGDERPDDAGTERAEDRPDLRVAGRDADRHRDAAEAGASKAITRSRRAGQTNRPSRSNGATRTSPTAPDASSSRATSGPTVAGLQPGSADAEERDIEAIPQLEHGTDARVGHEGGPRRGVVDQPRRHQAVRLGAERLGDPPVRLPFRAGRPVPAAQRHDRGRDGRRRVGRAVAEGLAERVGRRRDRGAVARSRRSSPRGPRPGAPARRAGRPSAGSGPRDRRSSARGGRRRGRSVVGGPRRRDCRRGSSRRSGSRRCPPPARA